MLRYEEQLETLLSQYTEQHPDVQALRSMIADLKANQGTGEATTLCCRDRRFSEFNPVYQDLKAEISKANVEVETLKIKLSEQENKVEKLKASIDVIPEVEARSRQAESGL